MQLLNFLGVSELGITANIQLNTMQGDGSYSMLHKHLNFFKERAREFLIENFLSSNNNTIGGHIKNEFYPILRLRGTA
jgi:hypothetical protein